MEGAKVKKVSPIGDKLLTESQTRSLKGVPIEDHAEIAEVAEKSGKITGKSLAVAAVAVAAKKPPGSVPKPPEVKDEKGTMIPQAVIPLWVRRPEIKKLMDAISEVKCHIKDALAKNDVLYAEIENTLIADLDTAYATIKCAMPYCVCPYCQGKTFKTCAVCGKRGLISKYKYDTAVPSDMKAIIDATIAKAKK